MPIRSKDFVETREGLIFAVLVDGTEDGRYLCFLRYLRIESGYLKLDTAEANRLLAAGFSRYLFHSQTRDADLHAVPPEDIIRHHRPVERLRQIIRTGPRDPIERKLVTVAKLLERNGVSPAQVGITGSLLIGAQTPSSDIDLVIYGRADFHRVREIIRQAVLNETLDPLDEAQWLEAYRRRGCSLSFGEYLWHEKRKFNKASWSGTKIDFSLNSGDPDPQSEVRHRKIKPAEITALITDDRRAFDHPAVYRISHPEIHAIASFTPTFAGQAISGETINARGMLEESDSRTRRLLIGSSREAPGEYIKVVRSPV